MAVEENINISYRGRKHKLRSIQRMLLFIVLVQIGVTALCGLINSFLSTPLPVYLQMLVIEFLAYLLPIIMYARENRILKATEAREKLGFKPFKNKLVPFVIILGFGCQFVMVILNLPLNLILSQSDGYVPQNIWELFVAMVVIGIIPAIFEEFILRGLVYGVMANFNDKAALIFSTVMFALLHSSPSGIIGYIFLGATLAIIFRRTGSLYSCVLLHLVNNITALLVSYFSMIELQYSPVGTLWTFAIGIVSAIVGAMGIMVYTKPPRSIELIKKSVLLRQSFMNIPIIICIILLISLMCSQF